MNPLHGLWRNLAIEEKRAAFVLGAIAATMYLAGAALWLLTGYAALLGAAVALTAVFVFVGGLCWVSTWLFPSKEGR